ncbi:MAG: TIGR03960 family B12-binding radical SAM protein [Planctomycetes bacterium]|nr:TIGR03960 family B12-binding radical SAM protein [Planctomycetota bacterium]MBI3845964.1 TIGR03960 family B12-binding radical SAM protein [Planctomycetota bacterium]
MTLRERVRTILPSVTTPGQYAGGEFNQRVKDHRSVDLRVAMCFPDTYAIGMSHLGLQILYAILNDRTDVVCERAFAPWDDMEAEMRRAGIPLFTLETCTPLRDYDVAAFSLSYEVSYTNLLNMLDLAGIPIYSRDRDESHPFVVAGGHATYSPEPVADFVDFFLPGDGEEVIVKFCERLMQLRRERAPRAAIVREIAKTVPGVYAPALYENRFRRDGCLEGVFPIEPGVPPIVHASAVVDLENAPFPTRPVVPSVKAIHQRVQIEVMRGCVRGCRFCQAGMITRPLRVRSAEKVMSLAREIYRNTGFDEIALTSLNTIDYPFLKPVMTQIIDEFESRRVDVSLPSLRIEDHTREVPALIRKVRKSGLTFAPETGSEFLRRIINKDIFDDNLIAAAQAAYAEGWDQVKLYFMIGHPLERKEDVEAIAHLSDRVSFARQQLGKAAAKVNVTVSNFVPKPWTPFQWEGMDAPLLLSEKRKHVLRAGKSQKIRYKFNDPDQSMLECLLTRGDRRLGDVIVRAWKKGCKFDGWDEHFDYGKWKEACAESGIDPDFFVTRRRDKSEAMPWDHIDCGVKKRYLWEERDKAYSQVTTESCQDGACDACGPVIKLCNETRDPEKWVPIVTHWKKPEPAPTN